MPERRRHSSRSFLSDVGFGTGVVRYDWTDPYHFALALPWWGFGLLLVASFWGINLLFATVYALEPGSVAGTGPHRLADCFFFSVQTFSTVGYGRLVPDSTYGNVVSVIQMFIGMLWFSVVTGLVFARFSRPRSRLYVAPQLAVGPSEGVPRLTARVINPRLNVLYDLEARMVLTTHQGSDGEWRVRDLKVAREHSTVELMVWTVVHVIDAASPLAGLTRDDLEACQAEILVAVSATEDTTMVPVHVGHAFRPADIRFGHAFAPYLVPGADGRPHFDLKRAATVVAVRESGG